jgi:O-antigen ligase
MGDGWRRRIAAVSCLLQTLGLILTYSRAAWVGAVLASLAFLISCRRWKSVAVILTICCASVVAVPTIRDRLFSLASLWNDASISQRVMLLREASAIGWNNPILGVGYGRGRVKAALRGRLRGSEFENNPLWHTHNVYVELFAGTGLLGLGSFLWMTGSGFAQAARLAAQDAAADGLLGFAFASSWLAMVICGFGDVPFFHHETRILLFTLFGLIVASSAIALTQIRQKRLE